MKHKNQKHFNRTRHVNGTQPELAVVVPVYNEEEDIERCSVRRPAIDNDDRVLF